MAEPFAQLQMETSSSSFQQPLDTMGLFQAPALLEHITLGDSLKPPACLQHQTQVRGEAEALFYQLAPQLL